MKYVLDTNTVSFLMKGDADVGRELLSHKRTDVYLPQPVLAEIEYGLSRLPRSARQRRLRERFDGICRELKWLDWTDEVSRSFGVTKADLEKRGVRIDELAVAISRHRVDGEIAPRQILFQCNLGTGVDIETGVTGGGFALGASEGVLLVGLGM